MPKRGVRVVIDATEEGPAGHREVVAFLYYPPGNNTQYRIMRVHWQSMRCRDPDTARGIILQVLRRSWGMAAFRENARLIVRRLGRVGDARASATIRNSESTHRRLRRIYENAAEHYRCVTTSGKHGRRH